MHSPPMELMHARHWHSQEAMRMAAGIDVVPDYVLAGVDSKSSGMDSTGIRQRDWS